MPKLEETQSWLRWIITEPAGVATALRSPRARVRPEPEPRQLPSIARRPPLSRTGRLDVYAEAYYSRLLEVLETDFPRLRERVGESLFRELVSAYLEAHPSRSFDLNELGAQLPGFVASVASFARFPWAGDMARLERARCEAFFARDPEPWDVDSLRALPAERLETLRFEAEAPVRVLQLQWAVDRVGPGGFGQKEDIGRENVTILVHRQGFRPLTSRLSQLQALALERAIAGDSLGDICARMADQLDDDEAAAREASQLFQWFNDWSSGGVLRLPPLDKPLLPEESP